MKVVQQLLLDDGHIANDSWTKDGSSILGKYIIGAKNNFRGFNSRLEGTSTLPKVTVHHEEEDEDTKKVDSDTKQESDTQQNQVGECGIEESKQGTDFDVVKMEEGRAKAEVGGDEKKDQVEAEKNDTENKVKEEGTAGTSFNDNLERTKVEAAQDEVGKKREEEILMGANVDGKHTEATTEKAWTVKVSNERTDVQRLVDKVKDIELQERKVGAGWTKGRKSEHDLKDVSDVRESNKKPGAKKTIPSPTGSNSSRDTGFGSQEGEGSIDGSLVKP